VKTTKPSKDKDLLPTRALFKELVGLRRTLRRTVTSYLTELENEITGLIKQVTELSRAPKSLRERTHALRDMIMLLRGLEVKPEKGRRRDLKRIELLLDDLKQVTGRW
jgi:hypothetical protein